jgi:peptidoglycan L-alanyl-D-glutamate endopeptidase CwlK
VSYVFGERSQRELRGVHPDLVAVVHRALQLTQIDFAVIDGLRTTEEQAEYVRTGASKTMNSKHLLQHDGYGHAVDLVPYVNGKQRWEWPLIFQVAAAMKQASIERNFPVRWGAVWDRELGTLGVNLAASVEAYKVRHSGDDFLDGPHYEGIV